MFVDLRRLRIDKYLYTILVGSKICKKKSRKKENDGNEKPGNNVRIVFEGTIENRKTRTEGV